MEKNKKDSDSDKLEELERMEEWTDAKDSDSADADTNDKDSNSDSNQLDFWNWQINGDSDNDNDNDINDSNNDFDCWNDFNIVNSSDDDKTASDSEDLIKYLMS